MISVNLLPEAYRKAGSSSFQQFHRSPLAIGLVGLLVGLGLLLVALRGVGQLRLAHLTARVNTLASKHQALAEVKVALAALREQHQTLQYLDRQRSHWAACLNVLSDAIPAGMWLTELTLEPQSKLILEGMAMSQGGQGVASVTRFVQELKADPRLAGVIRDIQIETVQNVQEGQIELTKFTLACTFTPTPGSSAREGGEEWRGVTRSAGGYGRGAVVWGFT